MKNSKIHFTVLKDHNVLDTFWSPLETEEDCLNRFDTLLKQITKDSIGDIEAEVIDSATFTLITMKANLSSYGKGVVDILIEIGNKWVA